MDGTASVANRRDRIVTAAAWLVACAAGIARAQSPAVSAWATGGASATATPSDPDGKPAGAAGSTLPPYWQATAVPAAVIQGGTIPAGWQPQAIAYQGVGPDGRVLTTYVAPTYVFTYQAGPPVLAIPQVSRRQGPGGQTPPAVVGPGMQPTTTARYAPSPYQFPVDSRAMSGTAIVPPSEPLPEKKPPAASPWVPSQPRPPALPPAPPPLPPAGMQPLAAAPPTLPPPAAYQPLPPAAIQGVAPAAGPPSAWGPAAPNRILGSAGNTAVSTSPVGVATTPAATGP